jgi:hypothetical protein
MRDAVAFTTDAKAAAIRARRAAVMESGGDVSAARRAAAEAAIVGPEAARAAAMGQAAQGIAEASGRVLPVSRRVALAAARHGADAPISNARQPRRAAAVRYDQGLSRRMRLQRGVRS